MPNRVIVIEKDENGNNGKFKDTKTQEIFTRSEFIRKIKDDVYADYTISKSKKDNEYAKRKPDGNKNTNLG